LQGNYAGIMKNIYLAAPLFSLAELDFNHKLKNEIEKIGLNVFLPQEDSNKYHNEDNRQQIIFNENLAAIDRSDILVAVLDGVDVDSGTAWEIGYAYAKGKPVFGLRTDFRTLGIEGSVNLMIERSIMLCKSITELIDQLRSV
jgi:nucleoside 2-deoxyribosyltransferase